MRPPPRQMGYTLIELLVVLAIVGILAIAAGSYVFFPRQKPAVQNLLGELEALVAESHKYASATLGNIQVTGEGRWADRSLQVRFETLGAAGKVVSAVRADAFPDRAYAGVDDADLIGTALEGETLEAALAETSPDLQGEVRTALANSLFKGGGQSIQLNAFNKQFLSPFCIPVVGLRSGATFAGAPAGYVVVSRNRIYKFYKAGSGPSNPWRRL